MEKFNLIFFEISGFETDRLKPPVWCGGESEALARLERHLERKAWVASFGHPKMTPQSLLASQTGLSPYLRFGCLSTRLFYYQLTELYKKVSSRKKLGMEAVVPGSNPSRLEQEIDSRREHLLINYQVRLQAKLSRLPFNASRLETLN